MKEAQIRRHCRFGSWLRREPLLVTLRKCCVGLAEVEAAAVVAAAVMVGDWILMMKAAELVAVWIEHSWMKGLLC